MLKFHASSPYLNISLENVDSIAMSSADGRFVILPGHMDMATSVNIAPIVVISKSGEKNTFFCNKGFVSVLADEVRVVSELLIDTDEANIDVLSNERVDFFNQERLAESAETKLIFKERKEFLDSVIGFVKSNI